VNPANQSLKILALETSAEYCSVSLRIGDKMTSADELAGQKHSELLLPMIDALLDAACLRAHDLDAVAFGAGPGSFTGLRIGCGVVQGLAFAADCLVVPVGSLEALAEATDGQRVVVCTDARMGQIYHGAFERNEQMWKVILPPSLCDPDRLPELSGTGWIGCGSGFERYRETLVAQYQPQHVAVKTGVVARAREIALLGAKYLFAGLGVPCTEAVPVYVRDKVALTMKEQK
jgi:tRNA threonylcarbamoyladenosine biosynthesis protein TsaB